MRPLSFLAAFLLFCRPMPGLAQSVSLWLDGGAIYARPPGGVQTPAADYATSSALLRITASRLVSARGAAFFGSGLGAAAETWLGGDAGLRIARPDGFVRPELGLDAAGLWYRRPFDYTALTAAARPGLALDAGDWNLSLAGELVRGRWTGTAASAGTGPPPFQGPPSQQTVEGSLRVTGAIAQVIRRLGVLTAGFQGQWLQATNGQAPGQYSGASASLAYASGRLSANGDVAAWRVPGDNGSLGPELGFDVGASVAITRAIMVHVSLDRSVRNPLYGSPGSLGAALGISWRVPLGGSVMPTAAPTPVALIGKRTGGGRRIRFSLRLAGAHDVALAGDFNGWRPRHMRRQGQVWTFDAVLPPGVYHFAFRVDGERWMVPDDAPGVGDDGWGRRTASIVVPGAL